LWHRFGGCVQLHLRHGRDPKRLSAQDLAQLDAVIDEIAQRADQWLAEREKNKVKKPGD